MRTSATMWPSGGLDEFDDAIAKPPRVRLLKGHDAPVAVSVVRHPARGLLRYSTERPWPFNIARSGIRRSAGQRADPERPELHRRCLCHMRRLIEALLRPLDHRLCGADFGLPALFGERLRRSPAVAFPPTHCQILDCSSIANVAEARQRWKAAQAWLDARRLCSSTRPVRRRGGIGRPRPSRPACAATGLWLHGCWTAQ